MLEKNFQICHTQELKLTLFDGMLEEFKHLKTVNNIIVFKSSF
jgi:hypothetical protein